jgi:hypothetical protein
MSLIKLKESIILFNSHKKNDLLSKNLKSGLNIIYIVHFKINICNFFISII